MKYLMIENKGEADPRAFTLLGASVKDSEAIGKFGSGTKYAIAKLVREGLNPVIFAGHTEVRLTVKKTEFRDKAFDILVFNDVETSITTATGLNWRVDHAVREFWSNALDEGEAKWAVMAGVGGRAGYTRIFIPMDRDIEKMVKNWDRYFLNQQAKPIVAVKKTGGMYRFDQTGNTPAVFRRGVWCVEDQDRKTLYSYDFYHVELPETRVIWSWDVQYLMQRVLPHLEDRKVMAELLRDLEGEDGKAFAESYGLYGSHPTKNQCATWLEVFKEKWQYFATGEGVMKYVPDKFHAVTYIANEWTADFLVRIGAERIDGHISVDLQHRPLEWPIGCEAKVEAACALLASNGIDIEWPIVYVQFEDSKTIALADMRGKRIMLGAAAFTREADSNRLLLRALIEEWTHLRHGVSDGTVEQQHVYLGLIVGLLR